MPIGPERIPLPVAAYRMATSLAAPFVPAYLERRRLRGKENADRMAERRGVSTAPRPPGPLIWVHGASVGEFAAMLPLVEGIHSRGFTVLVTTGTVTSAALAEKRLPPGAFHQFIPLDIPAFVDRFLDHWRPDLSLFVESELWPNLIVSTSTRGVPLILVNGRLSERSFARWRWFPKTIDTLLRRFDLCLARSPQDGQRYAALGAPRVGVSGNLKLDVPVTPRDPENLAALTEATQGRRIIVAASTHPGEESIVADVHRRLRITFPALLTIVAPRHPHRGAEVAEIAADAGLSWCRRSQGALPDPLTDVYIFDTLGELGLVYGMAPIVFMGGSLVRHGGQNPIEAIKLGAAILHGPHVANFDELYAELDRCEGARMVTDAAALTLRIGAWTKDGLARDRAAAAAQQCVEQLSGALDRTLAAIEPYLLQLRIENRALNA